MNEKYVIPKEKYLAEPTDESCYLYLRQCYERYSKDLGDITAFVVPVADQCSETKMSKLFDDIEKLAAYFASTGLKKGDVYSIFLPTCAHAFTAFYALNKLGVIASFVHPLTPPAALEENLKLTKSKGLFILDLFAAPFAPVLAKYPTIVCSTSDYCDGVAYKYAVYNEMQNAKVPELDTIRRFKDILAEDHPAAPSVDHPGRDDAFYLNGGGTTGKSKTIIHNNYAFNYVAYSLYHLDKPHDYKTAHCLCVLPCFHAYGLIGSMHYALCNAFKPIIISKFDPVQVNELIRKYNVPEILGVPKMYQKMIDAENFENEGTKNLMMCFAGGDVVTEKLQKTFDSTMEKHGASARLGRGYGLTEMCAICTSNGNPYYKADSTGYPIKGVTLEIWDDDGNRLPAGEIGEIVMTGESIMNGYLPDGNVPDNGIYTDKNGTPWVRTGDMAYVDEEGFLYFSGRKKRIIIIAGYNIYPATIEDKVIALDYISEVCAVQGYDEDGKPLVKLCVSLVDPEADRNEAVKKLKAFCEDNIEGYGCPRKYEIFDALPRTKMEKIDFMKLSDPVPGV
ncbi:MAG: class I adenylate-forming enzyme family protein [Oscillospiraceae bacterium]|nr:class I adenylate-forming enzyme family protein [Oscillospiraceae bacterium]